MKRSKLPPQNPAAGRRIAGHAQQDHILDPYERQRKPREGTRCPQCGVFFKEGRWQWAPSPEAAHEELCPACRRINDKFPAGIVTLKGAFARAHRDEMIRVARNQEEAEKGEHPLNRIMGIEQSEDGAVITTTDIHLPRRIGETLERSFHGALEIAFEEDGYFVRVDWTREA